MITHYTRNGLKSGDDFYLRDENMKLILSFTNLQRLGGRKYKVADSEGRFIYIVAENDIETKNEYIMYDDKSTEIIKVRRIKSLFSSKIMIYHNDKIFKFTYSLLPKLKMMLYNGADIAVTAELKNIKIGDSQQTVLQAEIEESDDLLLNTALFSTIGILYTDSY